MIVEDDDLIKVNLTFFDITSGGRDSGIIAGFKYRPLLCFSENNCTYCGIDFSRKNRIEPGESSEAIAMLVFPEKVIRLLNIGSVFKIYEGIKHVGNGSVLDILSENLRQKLEMK